MTLEKVTLDYLPTGDWGPSVLQQLLDNIVDEVNQIQNNVDSHVAILLKYNTGQTQAILMEYGGTKTLLAAKTHTKMKLKHVFALLADNTKRDVTIFLQKGNHQEPLTEKKTLKKSEKAGKAHTLDILARHEIAQWDSIEVVTSSNRKVIVVASFEGVD